MPIPRQEVIDNPIPTSLCFNKRSCTQGVVICPQNASPVSTNNYILEMKSTKVQTLGA